MHSTNDLNDRYFGSGKIIKYSLQKYGKENHVLETLAWCETREELALKESEIVSMELLTDPHCMNLTVGGNTTHHEYDRNPESAKLQAQSLRRFFEDPAKRERQRLANTAASKRPEVVVRVAKKLTVDDVQEIRRLRPQNKSDYESLARRFNVSSTTIWMIATYRTWKTISPPKESQEPRPR
jgi:hypothetical protein